MNRFKGYLKGLGGHLKTVMTHKKEVAKLCFTAGIPWQGIVHDLSKFSPTEVLESAKYYSGTRSPIVLCKEKNGYSMAWFHHRGRNPHHPEYWVDRLSEGGIPVPMPYKYNLEMVCDMIAASMAYNGKDFMSDKPLRFWTDVSSPTTNMHDNSRTFVTIMLRRYAKYGKRALNPAATKKLYSQIARGEVGLIEDK